MQKHCWSATARFVAVVFAISNARAEETQRRLLLLSSDRALAHAVESALRPWGIVIVTTNDTTLGPTMPLAAAQAKAIAERNNVDGVTWVSLSADGPALWTYDTHTGQATSRPLRSAPPYDEELAASVALSLKTELRSTEVAPEIERIARPAAAASSLSRDITPEAKPAPPPILARDAGTDDRAWTAEVAFGPRFGVGGASATTAEPRLALAIGHRWGRVGLAITGSFGLPVEYDGATYALHLTDTAPGIRGRFALLVLPRWIVAADAMFDAHFFSLSGEAGDPRLPISHWGFDVAFGLGLFVGVRPTPRVSIGIAPRASALPWRQHYNVLGDVALDEHPVLIDTFVLVGVDL